MTPKNAPVHCHVCGTTFVTAVGNVNTIAHCPKCNTTQLLFHADPETLLDDGAKIEFMCPFCGQDCLTGNIYNEEQQIVHGRTFHAAPSCPEWKNMSPEEFLMAAHVATKPPDGMIH